MRSKAIKENATKTSRGDPEEVRRHRDRRNQVVAARQASLGRTDPRMWAVLHRYEPAELQARPGRAKILVARLPAHPGFLRNGAGLAGAL